MSINAVSDYDELNSRDHLGFNPVVDYNGRKVEVLDYEARIRNIHFETRQKHSFSLSGHALKPMMASCTVRRKKPNGEVDEIEVVVITSPPPKSPEKPKIN